MIHDIEDLSPIPRARHSFVLVDELPGPSVGDAADHLKQLEIDPWQLDDILLIGQFSQGKMIAATFAVVGPLKLIEAFKTAIEKALSHSS